MDNSTIAENFSLLSKLMDIHGENSFKSRTYSVAAFNIDKLPVSLADVEPEAVFSLKGIGESVGRKINEMRETGKLAVLEEYIARTPPGVIEMLNIKGLGPKKINLIWKEMGIESIGELLYACNENRLTRYKGFGEKTQQNVQESIEFYLNHQGHFLYAHLDELFPEIRQYLEKLFAPKAVYVTGAFRRQSIVIEEMEFIVQDSVENIKARFQTAYPPEIMEETGDYIIFKLRNGLRLKLYRADTAFSEVLFRTTGSPAFLEAFDAAFPSLVLPGQETATGEDTSVFTAAGIPYILPCLRESGEIIQTVKSGQLPELIDTADITSIIHSHSNWSDGSNTIEEMANECIKRGLLFLVISDHSKAAAYANGLTEDRIREQHRYIDTLNEKLAPFKIFKSIECDILNDGSLDYSDRILSTFDLVIASVHSNLKMTEEKAMNRLLKAIENPYTTILGHMTGRLLLSRNGYPVDHKKIIDACAANRVAIEINAHPRRLDIDWKWIPAAMEKGVMLSVNPDAHSLDGYNDVKYGVLAARKGGLVKEKNLSSFSLPGFEHYLSAVRKAKGF